MVTIRPATEQDFSGILDIQRAAFGEYTGVYKATGWTSETIESLARDAQEKNILVAEWDGKVAGSVRFWTVGGVCVIRLLSVRPDIQHRGIGKALMREVERLVTNAHKLYVCTMLRTSRNVALFLNLGYRPESLMPDHYNRMDMICFSKPHRVDGSTA
ncbi:MAG TPA: GNAT family N-acetyltransferase [Nitrospiraceae bacterium]|nr:GNAT family N-acetyltransferase [Nitrospiraceae bacterium]